ncbi:hypothetical protein EYF80_030311 [Liparis tanakae]|uniref:Uncharacterized protein n=1 Tax=Liparis tanakae TaxID=230148 RepID=A0A4Z2H158_9TELE|nr:hypothetical protein EYF80_030311 [Liparis tanakae]
MLVATGGSVSPPPLAPAPSNPSPGPGNDPEEYVAVPAGEASDWAMSAAMAELGFSLLPNMWEGARLKTDPGRPLTCRERLQSKLNSTCCKQA